MGHCVPMNVVRELIELFWNLHFERIVPSSVEFVGLEHGNEAIENHAFPYRRRHAWCMQIDDVIKYHETTWHQECFRQQQVRSNDFVFV